MAPANNYHLNIKYPAPHNIDWLNHQCIPLQGALCMTIYMCIHRREACVWVHILCAYICVPLCVCVDSMCNIHNSCIYAYMNDPETLIRHTWYSHTLWNILHQNVTWPIYHIHTKMLHGPSLTPHTKVLHDPYLPPHTRIHMTPGQTGGNIGSVSILSHTEHHHLTSIPVVMCTCTGLHKYNILSF